MKLLAYILNGEILGVEKTSWTGEEFQGEPFMVITGTTVPDGWADISTLLNWGSHGEACGLTYVKVRNAIKPFIPSNLSTLTQDEIDVLTRYNLYNYFKIYDYLNDGSTIINSHPPVDVDYDILGFHKKRTLVKGELTKVEYYGDYNSTANTYSNKVVSEDRVYKRVNQMAHKREMTIKWYLSDGSVGHSKDTIKYYSTSEAMAELDARRSNIIADLKMNTIGLIMMCSGVTSVQAQGIGKPLLSTYSVQITKYEQGYEQELRDSIATDAIHSYLNCIIPGTGGITIRQYLIAGLTIDYSINNINT